MLVEIADGKYAIEIDEDQHRIQTYRNGEYWNEETGNKFLCCVAQEIQGLRDKVEVQSSFWRDDARQLIEVTKQRDKLLNALQHTNGYLDRRIPATSDLIGDNTRLIKDCLRN